MEVASLGPFTLLNAEDINLHMYALRLGGAAATKSISFFFPILIFETSALTKYSLL
jgi:hypothetical protein